MTELKPCPFCGSKNINVWWHQKWNTYSCECENCSALAPNPASTMYTEQEAIELWNKRINNN